MSWYKHQEGDLVVTIDFYFCSTFVEHPLGDSQRIRRIDKQVKPPGPCPLELLV